MIMTWLRTQSMLVFITECCLSIWNSLIRLIMCSIKIHKLAIVLVCRTSVLDNFSPVFTRGGRKNFMPFSWSACSRCLKPLCAKMQNPSCNPLRKLQFSTMVTSLALPPNPWETLLIKPLGMQDIKYFAVLPLLYSNHVSAWWTAFEGFCMSISKQSIIQLTLW